LRLCKDRTQLQTTGFPNFQSSAAGSAAWRNLRH